MILLNVVDSIKSDLAQTTFELYKFSLRNRVLEEAKKGQLKLLRVYKVPEGQAPGPEVDMWDEFRAYLQRLNNNLQVLPTWAEDDCKHFRLSYQYIRRQLVSLSTLLCSTTNNTASDDIQGSFVADAIGVLVIQDEAAMDIETNAWVPIIKGRWPSLVIEWLDHVW